MRHISYRGFRRRLIIQLQKLLDDSTFILIPWGMLMGDDLWEEDIIRPVGLPFNVLTRWFYDRYPYAVFTPRASIRFLLSRCLQSSSLKSSILSSELSTQELVGVFDVFMTYRRPSLGNMMSTDRRWVVRGNEENFPKILEFGVWLINNKDEHVHTTIYSIESLLLLSTKAKQEKRVIEFKRSKK
eukprot:GHVH01000482.1.p1 GENE.GHVH01000482.1~~GHVH01000482.1.p1  ORF type:complete len:185 (+),score=16.47 GHVH01000482.1:245-799(+)